MPIETKVKVVVMEGHCPIEEAEILLQSLTNNSGLALNLKKVEHLHTAIIQVIMACQPRINVWPQNAEVERVVQSAYAGNKH